MEKTRTITIRLHAAALDERDFPLGVVRLAPDQSITYFNRSLRRIIGVDLKMGLRAGELPLLRDSRSKLANELQERYEQERSGGYRLVMKRSDTNSAVHMRVAALPEYDTEGQLKGSIGFVVDDTLQNVSTSIYRAMQEARVSRDARSGMQLLKKMTGLLRALLPFDSLMVTVISKDRLHLRKLFESPSPPPAPIPFRWWPMPEFVQRMVSDLQPGVIDLEELYREPDFAALAKTDLPTRQFQKRGFRSCLRFTVQSRGEQVGIVSLLRLRKRPDFGTDDLKLCAALPLADAVGLAMNLDAQQQQQVFLALEGRLTASEGPAMDIAQWLVDRLRRHCRWEHVSLFRAAEERGRLLLVCQAREQVHRLPDGFELSMSKGLLGRCVRTGRTVNVPDVGADPDYQVGIKGTKSELIVPLRGNRVLWLLNIESTDLNAFGSEEERAVERLVRVAATVLGRAAARETQAIIEDSVGDAVILTNETNVIRHVNRACLRMLDYERDEMIGQDLSFFLPVSTDPGPGESVRDTGVQPWEEVPTIAAQIDISAASLIHSNDRVSEVLHLLRRDGATVPVLMSTATTPGLFGGKVFIASDLSNKQYLDRVGRLVPTFRQLASEIRVPLALASTFLQDADGAPADRLAKARLQIRKADVSLGRVMHAVSVADRTTLECTNFELDRVVERVRESLPEAQARALDLASEGDQPIFVKAAFPQLLFCLETLLAPLLRATTAERRIQLRTGPADQGAFIGLRLRVPGVSHGAVPAHSAREAVLVDAVVPTLMERMGGRYVPPAAGRHEHRLELSLAR